MRIEYKASTGDPFGQFVVYPEGELDQTILYNFLQGKEYNMKFWLHGSTYGESGLCAFNFGWIKAENDSKKK